MGRRGRARTLRPRGPLLPRGRAPDRSTPGRSSRGSPHSGAPGPALPGAPERERSVGEQRRPGRNSVEVDQLRARLTEGPCFFTDLLAELDLPAEGLRETLWDLVWAGEVTNDAWAPLRAPRLVLARQRSERRASTRRRFGTRRTGAQSQVQGRWSLTGPVFAQGSRRG